MTDYANAIWIPNSNAFIGQNHPRYIVLHGTGGGISAQAIADYFASTQGTTNPVSSHYIVGQDGTVVQCVSEVDGAWANGYISGPAGTSGNGYGNGFHDTWWDSGINPNNLCISIEHVKSATDNSSQLSDVQKLASFKLIKDICTRYNIPTRKADAHGGITGHYSIDPVNRQFCPGPYPWDELFAFLQGDTSVLDISHASQYFIEVTPGQRWHCKSTGFDIADGILNYYRTCTQTGLNGLSQFGLPLTGEQTAQGYKNVVVQKFERGIIAYDPGHEMDSVPGLSGPCYPAHIIWPDASSAITSAINTLQTAQVTAQALDNAIGSTIAKLKG
jgi:N-acetyl-anhydromuramyl-L-alanine amidase AmpD